MSKKIACFLALCIVSMGLTVLLPTGMAQPSGSVITGDGDDPPNYKDYFDYGEWVYYYVHATEAPGVPLQNKAIDITIVGPPGVGEVHTNVIFTDDFGDASGFWIGTFSSDLFTIYANYTGNNIAINTFRVYEPYPDEAEVTMYRDSARTEEGYYFSSSAWIYYRIYVKDQWDNPYYESWDPDDLRYWVYHNGEERDFNSWRNTNSEGYINDLFIPSNWFVDDEIYGVYQINVTRQEDGTHIGNDTFEVVDVDLEVTPYKSQYAQGDEITITIETTITGTIDVRILNPDDEALSNANWTDQSLINGQWIKDYMLGTNLPDGDYEIMVLKDDQLMEAMTITVKKYILKAWTDSEAYLPGETITTYYTITHNKDGSGVTGTTVEWSFSYYDTVDSEWDSFTNSFTAGASGTFDIGIPSSASKWSDATLNIWSNDTTGHSSYDYIHVELGGINAYLTIDDDEYLAGDFVVVKVSANIAGTSPLRNGNVYLNVSKEGVEIPGYTVNNLKTDSRGSLTYIFVLESNAEVGLYTVAINVSKLNEWDKDKETFEIVENREMWLELGFDNKYHSDSDYPLYYSDDTVTVTYTALRGEGIVENVNCEYWVYYDGDNYISAGTTAAGEFAFDIPEDFEGRLRLSVQVTDSEGEKASSTAWIDVEGPSLLLKPKMNEYLPGDTVKIGYNVVGTQQPEMSYYYEIEDDDYPPNIVKREGLTQPSGEFQFKVPVGNVPDSYTIRGYITDNIGNSIAESYVMVTRLRGYMITFSLDKRTYRPGETATLHYKITTVDGSEIPQDFRLFYGYSGGEQRSTQASKAKGNLKVKVPEDAADGSGFFYIYSDLPYGSGNANAQQEANIRSNPNPLAETIGDMPFLSLILLILVIIALIFGIGGWRRGKKALEEAKLPPWKKEGPLPEPEKFKEPEELTPPPVEEDVPSPPEDTGPEPPKDMPPP